MAITINGSGTISGISAGGLPDGSVTAADIASVGAGAMPSGSVIQTKWNNFTSGYTGTTTSLVWLGSNFQYNITPQYSDSKILLMVSTGLNMICDGKVFLRRSTDGGSNWTTINTQWFGATRVDNQYDYEYSSGMHLDSPATTNNVLYELGVQASGCAGILRIGAADANWQWTLMEIAA